MSMRHGFAECDYLKMANIVVKRGEIFYADLSPVIGSEQGGIRPVIIIQNDIGNRYSPTVIIAAITSQINKAKLPIHVEISSEEYGLNRDSVVLLEQIRTLDKKRLKEKIGHMTEADMKKVDKALAVSLNLNWQKEFRCIIKNETLKRFIKVCVSNYVEICSLIVSWKRVV